MADVENADKAVIHTWCDSV